MRHVFLGLAVASGLCYGVALGQNAQPQPQPRPGVQPPAATQLQPRQPAAAQPAQPKGQLAKAGGQMSPADQQVAAMIHGGSHNEVEISKFAQSKLKSAEARAFAEKMVQDHTADAESYQRWAGKQGDAALEKSDDAASRAGQAATEAHAKAQHGGGLEWSKVHEQLAKQCLESAKQELGRYQGSEFDQAYLGMQLAGHLHMQDTLKVLRNHASPELQQQIDKSQQVVQTHMQHARQIMEQLKDSPPARVSRTPDSK